MFFFLKEPKTGTAIIFFIMRLVSEGMIGALAEILTGFSIINIIENWKNEI
jgi:hypothetical protein